MRVTHLHPSKNKMEFNLRQKRAFVLPVTVSVIPTPALFKSAKKYLFTFLMDSVMCSFHLRSLEMITLRIRSLVTTESS